MIDKVIIVTGASSGIGAATALDLAQNGAKVVLAARRLDKLDALAHANAHQMLAVQCDVTKRDQVENLVAKTCEHFGRCDVLVNNAGVMPLSYMKNLHLDEWEQMIDINLKGALHCIAAVLPKFQEQTSGHIVNIGSVASRRLFPGGAVYCATKFGLRAISEGLRLELDAKLNIRVSMIEPGAVATELANTISDKEYMETSEFNVERLLDAEDVARSIRYVIEQPAHVNVEEVMIMPKDQNR